MTYFLYDQCSINRTPTHDCNARKLTWDNYQLAPETQSASTPVTVDPLSNVEWGTKQCHVTNHANYNCNASKRNNPTKSTVMN